MAIDEAMRHRIFGRIEEILGEETASVLMTHMPPINWADMATKQDLANVERRLEAKIDGLENRLDAKIDGLELRLDAKIDSKITGLTRTLVLASTGQMIAFVGLVFAAARLT